MAKDFLGEDLNIDDDVVFAGERGKELTLAKVEGFVRGKTEKVIVRWSPRHSAEYDWGSMKITPRFLVKVPSR